jgi:DNA-binding GntR family transcriptional regulator
MKSCVASFGPARRSRAGGWLRQLGQQSVLPVSDALKRLEEDGLVETQARRGRASRSRRARMCGAIEREALETQSARLFLGRQRPSRRELQRLAGNVVRCSSDWRRRGR